MPESFVGKNSDRFFKGIITFALVLATINAAAYVYLVAAPFVQADVFRHLEEVIIPFLQGRKNFLHLWSNQHPSPVLHLIQIANIKLFDFRLDYHAYLGFTFQLATVCLLIRHMLYARGTSNNGIDYVDTLFVVATIVLLLGFNTPIQYSWPLLTTVQYLYCFGICLILSIDSYVRSYSGRALAAICIFSAILMFANVDYGTLFLIVSLLLLGVSALISRKRALVVPAAFILIALLLCHGIVYFYTGRTSAALPDNYIGSFISYIFTSPFEHIKRASIALGTGLINTRMIVDMFPHLEKTTIFFSLVLGGLFCISIFLFFIWEIYRKTLLPLGLMLFALAFLVSSYIIRISLMAEHQWGMAIEHYMPTYKFAVIGAAWTLWLIFKSQGKTLKGIWSIFAVVASTLSFGFFIAVQAYQIANAWEETPYKHWNHDNHALAIYFSGETIENTIELPATVHAHFGTGRSFSEAVQFLKTNSLNVFANSYPAGPIFGRFIQAKADYHAIPSDTTVAIGRATPGKVNRIDINMILPANGRHPVKRIDYATEVINERQNREYSRQAQFLSTTV